MLPKSSKKSFLKQEGAHKALFFCLIVFHHLLIYIIVDFDMFVLLKSRKNYFFV